MSTPAAAPNADTDTENCPECFGTGGGRGCVPCFCHGKRRVSKADVAWYLDHKRKVAEREETLRREYRNRRSQWTDDNF